MKSYITVSERWLLLASYQSATTELQDLQFGEKRKKEGIHCQLVLKKIIEVTQPCITPLLESLKMENNVKENTLISITVKQLELQQLLD